MCKGLKKCLTNKMTFEQRSEGSEELGHVDLWGKSIANRENSKYKGPGVSDQKSRGVVMPELRVGDEGRTVVVGCEVIFVYAWGISCSTLKAIISTLSTMKRQVL